VISSPAPENRFVGAVEGVVRPGNGFLGTISLSVPEKEVFLAARTSNGFSIRPYKCVFTRPYK